MSGRKLPPSQQTLTQMSCHDKKRRPTDRALLSLAQKSRRQETVTSRVVDKVRTQSTTVSAGLGVDLHNSFSSAEDSEANDNLSNASPCLLPVVKFVPSLHERHGCAPHSPPHILPVTPSSKSKDSSEWGKEMDADDECPRQYLDVNSKQFIRKYNKLLSKCNRLEMRAVYYRKRMRQYKKKLEKIKDLCNSRPSSSDSD